MAAIKDMDAYDAAVLDAWYAKQLLRQLQANHSLETANSEGELSKAGEYDYCFQYPRNIALLDIATEKVEGVKKYLEGLN